MSGKMRMYGSPSHEHHHKPYCLPKYQAGRHAWDTFMELSTSCRNRVEFIYSFVSLSKLVLRICCWFRYDFTLQQGANYTATACPVSTFWWQCYQNLPQCPDSSLLLCQWPIIIWEETIQYLWLHHVRLLVDGIWQGNPWISLLILLHWWFFCVLASRTRPPEEDTYCLSWLWVYQKLTFTNLHLNSTSHSHQHHLTHTPPPKKVYFSLFIYILTPTLQRNIVM
jgi:hypothetical protein